MGDKDKISKMIIHRMQQERKNDQRRMHKNKIERDRLNIQTRYIDWSKSICANDFASSKLIFVKRLEKLYERRQEIEENKKNNSNSKKKKMNDKITEVIQQQQRNENKREPDLKATTDNRNSDNNNKNNNNHIINNNNNITDNNKIEVEVERRKKDVMEKHRNPANQAKEARKEIIMAKIKSLASGYRDNDPPPQYYRRKGIQPPEKLLNHWLSNDQPNIYASLASAHQPEQHRKSTTATSTGGGGGMDPRTQLRSAPASTDKMTSSPRSSQQDQSRTRVMMNAMNETTKTQQQRPKTAAPSSNRKPPTGSNPPSPSRRPKTAGSRLFTSSNTHLSEAEQDFVKRRIRRKSACIRRERNQLASSTTSDHVSRCGSAFRSRSSLSRDEGRKLIDYLSNCKQTDLDGGVADVQIQAKKLLIAATQEYQKCLQQDVSKFIVENRYYVRNDLDDDEP